MLNEHKFKIADSQSKKEWEELFGARIHGNIVRVPHDKYVENALAIHAIQMSAAFRHKRISTESVAKGV